MNKQKTKQDMILLFGMVLAAFLAWAVFAVLNYGNAQMVVVIQDGQEIARYPLSADETVTIPFNENGYNLLMISGGEAAVSDADCPDRLCVSQRAITGKGESIICLPHKLVITIDSDKEGELDAITY